MELNPRNSGVLLDPGIEFDNPNSDIDVISDDSPDRIRETIYSNTKMDLIDQEM